MNRRVARAVLVWGVVAGVAAPVGAGGTPAAGGLAVADPLADPADLYAWMDAGRLVLALTVSPADTPARAFGPAVQYVFHVTSKPGLGVGQPGGSETQVVCTFASDSAGQCWVTDAAGAVVDHVAGDPRTPGLASRSGKLALFAGRRADPRFFHLQGFRNAVTALRARLATTPAVTVDAGGCPTSLTDPEVASFRAALTAVPATAQPPCLPDVADCFAHLDVRAIVVQLDRGLVNVGNNTAIGVWASTHAAP